MIKFEIKGDQVCPEDSYEQLFYGRQGWISDGRYRCWLTEGDVDLLFKSDAALVKPFLTRGRGSMEGYLLIYEASADYTHGALQRVVTNDHHFDDIDLRDLPLIRSRISTLLSDDQSDSASTNALLSRALFEVLLIEDQADSKRIRKLWPDVYTPFIHINIPGPLKKFTERLHERAERARLVGIENRLSQLPPRPSPQHSWRPKEKRWEYEATYGVEMSIYAYKGVNGWD